MSYALDRLGWLQFQQLCTQLLELDAGVAPGAWNGLADSQRFTRRQDGLGSPLLAYDLPGPVLIQCAWTRSAGGVTAEMALGQAVDALAQRQGPELDEVASYLLICNGELSLPLRVAAGDEDLRVGVLGIRELSARIDARPELRLRMPSLLGVRDLGDLIPPETSAGSTLDCAAAQDLAAVFVPTRAHRRALDVLGEHRFAVLTGPPEMGKTATAQMIALAQMTAGWEAHECTTPEAVVRAWRGEIGQVFVADDAFGSTEYRADAADRWARELERLLRMLDDRHWLIWTSRPAPLHAALRRLHRERGAERFPAPARVLVDAGDLDGAEKALILFRHAKAAELSPRTRREIRAYGGDIVGEPHFTPERIRRLVAGLRSGDTHVARAIDAQLTAPTEAMAVSLDALADEHRDVLVALLDAPPGPVPERELTAALRRHHDGSLSHPPAELVDRLADHFLRVHA